MFFQILPRVDLQPRVLVSSSEPIAVAPKPVPAPPVPPIVPKQLAVAEEEPDETAFFGPTTNFIKAVQSQPVLYCGRGGFVANRQKRNAWSEVAKTVNLPAEQCQQKWKALRDFYVKKKRMEENEFPVGVSKRKWPYMQAMSFIDPYLRRYNNQYVEKISPTDANSATSNGNLPSTEGNRDTFILGTDSTSQEGNSNNETVNVKLEPSSDDLSQEVAFEEVGTVVPPLESPATSCDKDGKPKKRKADDPEDILEVAITKLLNEPSPPPEDYLELRTKALCLLIRSRNLDTCDQQEVLRRCEEVVVNYKKKSQ